MDLPLSEHSVEPSSRRSWLSKLFHNYLNSGIAEGASSEIRFVNAITLIGTLNIFSSVFIELMTGKLMIAGFMFAMTTCAVLNVILLRRSQNARLAATLILGITLAMLTVMLLDGMYENTAPVWLATFPAIAFFFKGKYQGLMWLSSLLGILLLIMLAQSAALLHTPFSNSALALIIASTATVGMMVYVYESMRAKAEASLQQARKKLHHLAHTDMLTGLPNRIAFYAQLPLALNRARENDRHLAVLFIDLDNFKPINDSYGHEAGDELLKQVAVRLQYHLRSSNFIARFGGDEFVAILPELQHKHEVSVVAEKLIDALTPPFVIQGYACNIGVSIGIALFPDCALDVDELVKLADHAMYKAKLDGKNNYVSCPLLEGSATRSHLGEVRCSRSCLNQHRDSA